jgi:hypothetical protein
VPLSLLFFDNGELVARVLANRRRQDLLDAGVGDGRNGFSINIPGGLSAIVRHVIQVLGEADGCVMSPLACEGIDIPNISEKLVGRDAKSIAASILALHSDQASTESISKSLKLDSVGSIL